MNFVVIMAFAFVLSDSLPPGPLNLVRSYCLPNGSPAGPGLTWTLFIVACQAIIPALVALGTRTRVVRQLRVSCDGGDAAAAHLSVIQQAMIFIVALLLILVMAFFPWVPLIRDGLGLGQFPLIGEIVILLPFFVSLVLVWIVFYPVETRIRTAAIAQEGHASHQELASPPISNMVRPSAEIPHEGGMQSMPSFLVDKCRHQFLIIAAPMLLIVFAKHFTDLFKETQSLPTWFPRQLQGWVGDTLLGAASIATLVISPLLLRYLWSTKPLPQGPLRERFERTCRRMNLRYNEILLWQTHGMAVNAAVMGFVPWLRYILVSDALLETMDDDEIEAVFGHEAGHIKHWHLVFFGIFAIVSMYVAGGAFELLRLIIRLDQGMLELASLVILLSMWLFGFGWLSRRFERQADLFGVRCVTPDVKSCRASCPVHGEQRQAGVCISAASLFGRTLTRIAELNGIPPEAPSWRHGSIQSRCRLIEQFVVHPEKVARFDRQVLSLKIGLLAAAIIGTVAAAAIYYPRVAPIVRGMLATG